MRSPIPQPRSQWDSYLRNLKSAHATKCGRDIRRRAGRPEVEDVLESSTVTQASALRVGPQPNVSSRVLLCDVPGMLVRRRKGHGRP
jgi:hypothetical protein